MKRLAAVLVAFGLGATVATIAHVGAAPGDLVSTNNTGGSSQTWAQIPGTPCWRQSSTRIVRPWGTPFSDCSPATTTTTVAPTTTTSTTVAPSTTTTTTTAPTTTTTTVAPTTQPPSGVQFVEAFDGNSGLERFNRGVYHRDPHNIDQTQWQGDHDLNCGTPATTRTIHRSAPAESFYNCVDHMMTSMGDTSGYSIVWFSPNQSFPSVNSVSFDVNLTNLGARKWWKVGVVSEATYNSTYANSYGGQIVPGFMVSDVGASSLRGDLQNSGLLIATWSGQASAGWPGGFFKIGDHWPPDAQTGSVGATDKATRYSVSLVDNKNGTITFTFRQPGNGAVIDSTTQTGSFPACPCRVVFYDHNYTPNKSDPPAPVSAPYTWHWDNVVVR